MCGSLYIYISLLEPFSVHVVKPQPTTILCMYIHKYIYIYIHSYTRICVYSQIHQFTFVNNVFIQIQLKETYRYIYIHIYVYIYRCITYIYTSIFVYKCINEIVGTQPRMYAYSLTMNVCMYTHVCEYKCVHMCICICIHIYRCTAVKPYIYIYVYRYRCIYIYRNLARLIVQEDPFSFLVVQLLGRAQLSVLANNFMEMLNIYIYM